MDVFHIKALVYLERDFPIEPKKDCPSSLRFWRDTSKKARETNVNGRKTEEGGREEKKLGQTRGETAHCSRDTGRKGEMSPKLQRVFVSLAAVGRAGGKPLFQLQVTY